MEFVEDCARAILEISGREDGNAVLGQLLRESGAAVVVFESGNTGSHFDAFVSG